MFSYLKYSTNPILQNRVQWSLTILQSFLQINLNSVCRSQITRISHTTLHHSTDFLCIIFQAFSLFLILWQRPPLDAASYSTSTSNLCGGSILIEIISHMTSWLHLTPQDLEGDQGSTEWWCAGHIHKSISGDFMYSKANKQLVCITFLFSHCYNRKRNIPIFKAYFFVCHIVLVICAWWSHLKDLCVH